MERPELFRVTINSNTRFLRLDDIVGRCYLMSMERYLEYRPLVITDDDTFICDRKFENFGEKAILDDRDKKEFVENCGLKNAFVKREKRLPALTCKPLITYQPSNIYEYVID